MAAGFMTLATGGRVGGVSADSAGLLEAGLPSPRAVCRAVAPYGLDLSRHRSRRLDEQAVRSADLVLGMERRHAREALLLDADALPRVFTLKDFVRRAEAVGPHQSTQPLDEWLGQINRGRRRADLVGRRADDDVQDPLGSPNPAIATTALEIRELVTRVAVLLSPDPAGPR